MVRAKARCGAMASGIGDDALLVCVDPRGHLGAHRSSDGVVFRDHLTKNPWTPVAGVSPTGEPMATAPIRVTHTRGALPRVHQPARHGSALHIREFDDRWSDTTRVLHLKHEHGYSEDHLDALGTTTTRLIDLHDRDHVEKKMAQHRAAVPADEGPEHMAEFEQVESEAKIAHLIHDHGQSGYGDAVTSDDRMVGRHEALHEQRAAEPDDEPEYTEQDTKVGRRRAVLRRAEAIVCGTDERAEGYGGAEDSFAVIAELWTTILKRRVVALFAEETFDADGASHPREEVERLREMLADVRLTEADVALLMDALKTARLIGNIDHGDSWDDKAGYAACGWDKAVTP